MKEYNVGDVVQIKNSIGILNVTITEILSKSDICQNRSTIDSLNAPRLEFHFNKNSQTLLVTLCDSKPENLKSMWLCLLDAWDFANIDNIKFYKGTYKTEVNNPYFDTIE